MNHERARNTRHCRLVMTLALGGVTLLGGCATARLNQYRGFAQAGVAYTKASQTLTEQAGTASISADTAILLKNRPDLPADDRRTAVTESDTLLKQRLIILQQIKGHAQLLQTYFQTISDMADSKAGNDLGSAAEGTYNSLARFSEALKTATIGKEKVADFIPAVINIVVANVKVRALDSELNKRASLIERELAVQEAALAALAKDLHDNLAIKLNIDESQGIINAYAGTDRLPSDWASQRQQVLTTNVAVQSATDATRAARTLRESFARLVAGTLTEGAIGDLIQDINSVLDLASKIKGA